MIGYISNSYSSDEEIFAEAYFYENATFQGYWGTIIKNDGVVVTEYNKNLLDFENEPIVKTIKLNNSELDILCGKFSSFGFFNLPEYIAPGGAPVDGPSFSIRITCDNVFHRVDFSATSTAKSDENSNQFIKAWDTIGELMPIKAPDPLKYVEL